jgi:hypothetical protein
MKRSSLLAGGFLVLLGVLFLLSNFGLINFDWGSFWKYWPIIFILLGLSYLLNYPPLRVIGWLLVPVFISSLLFAIFNNTADIWNRRDRNVSTKEFSYDLNESLEIARFSLKSGAGEFVIRNTTDKLFYVKTESSLGEYKIDQKQESDGTEDVTLSLDAKNSIIDFIGRNRNDVSVQLSSRPLWEVTVDSGAANLELDLSQYRISKLDIDSGASSMDVKLGDLYEKTDVKIDTGASSVRINVPKSSGVDIFVEGGLTSTDLSGFRNAGEKRHRSENFDETSKKIYITIEAGVSSIDVNRY